MTDEMVRSTYQVAAKLSFVLVETASGQERVIRSDLERLKSRAEQVFALKRPTKPQYADILTALGLRYRLDTETLDQFYSLTGGHLKLSREVVKILNTTGANPDTLGEGIYDAPTMAARLLRLRMASIDPDASALERLLSIAAHAGKEFSRREIECAFDNPDLFSEAVALAHREELLTGSGDVLAFVHDVVREGFQRIGSNKGRVLHDRLAVCLQYLQPGEYGRRLRHSRRAGDDQRTRLLAFALRLQQARGEAPDSDLAFDINLGELQPVLLACLRALKLMDCGQHTNAIKQLSPLHTGDEGLVQGELTYLIILNLYKTRSKANYLSAISIGHVWNDRKDEGELWYRLMLTLAVILSESGEGREASSILRRLRIYLERQARFDPSARSKLNVLNRKAEIFFPTELAGSHMREAVRFFGPPEGMKIPRNAFQYVAALVNLSGNCFLRGEFKAAMDLASKAVECFDIENKMGVRLVESYKVVNNFAIGALRAEALPPANIASILGDILQARAEAHRFDSSLVVVNCGAALALAGRCREAKDLLMKSWQASHDDDLDGYYVFYIGCNLASVCMCLGDWAQAKQFLSLASAFIGDIRQEFHRCHRKRMDVLLDRIEEQGPVSPHELDRLPMSFDPDGPHVAWRSLGYGFLLSDIQVWSES